MVGNVRTKSVLVMVGVLALAAAGCVLPQWSPPATTTTTTVVTTTVVPNPCPKGFYNSTDGNEPCTPAPAGFFVPNTGSILPTPCAPGYFQDAAGQIACLPAPLGSYVPGLAATSAILCPAGSTTLFIGASSELDCVPV